MTDASLVAWWLAKYGREAQQIEAAEQSKRDADSRHRLWRDDTVRPLKRNAAWWRAQIDGYVWDKLRAECGDREMTDPKVWKHLTKRFTFPTGYVQARRVGESFEVSDSAKWQAWVMGEADAGASLVALWERLSVWLGEDASTMASVNIPVPEWGNDDRFAGRFDGDGNRVVIVVDTAEIVPGLTWTPARIELNKPHTEDIEHPAWTPAPEGHEDEDVPADWQAATE